MKKPLIAILALTSAAFALPAAAQMRSPALSSAYVGASIGQSKFEVDCEGIATCDEKDNGFRIFAGYQFNRSVAAELGFASLGKAHFGDVGGSADLKADAWDLSAIGSLPVGPVSLFGRLGLYRATAKFSGDVRGDETSMGLTWGLGAQYDFTRNLGVRAEWQRYNGVEATTGSRRARKAESRTMATSTSSRSGSCSASSNRPQREKGRLRPPFFGLRAGQSDKSVASEQTVGARRGGIST
jgi:OmpA-OmpF porin, OOP family